MGSFIKFLDKHEKLREQKEKAEVLGEGEEEIRERIKEVTQQLIKELHSYFNQKIPDELPLLTVDMDNSDISLRSDIMDVVDLIRIGKTSDDDLYVIEDLHDQDRLLTKLGNTYFFMNNFQKAASIYEELINIEVGNLRYYNAAIIRAHNKLYTKALEYFNEISIEKNKFKSEYFWKIENNRGVIYEKLGRKREAIDHFQSAIKIKDDNYTLSANFATTLKNFSDEKAISTFENLLDRFGTKSYTLEQLGDLYAEKGEFNKALEFYKELVKLNKKNYSYKYNYGTLLMITNNYKDAVQVFQEISANEASPKYYNNLGVCFLKLENKIKAKEYFEKALEIDPNYSKAKKNLTKV